MIESIEFRYLRWAAIASKQRSIRRAAEILNIRQSTLSRRLRELEHHLGVALFERTNGGTRPTAEGLEFIEVAQRIIEETENLATRLKTRPRGETGRLAIGVHASLSAGNLRAALIEHHHRFPEVRLNLVDGSSDHLVSDLENSAIDIAFVADHSLRWSGKSLSVWTERVVVALPDTHVLAEEEAVHWHDLKSKRVILPQRGPGPEFLKLLTGKLGHHNAFDIQRHDVALDRLLTLVGAGLGVLLALEGATGVTYTGVVFREIHGDDGPTRVGFHALWRQENSNPSLHCFLDMLRERYPDFSTGPSVA